MIGLPEKDQRVRVWPMPGRQAQFNEWPVDAAGGGRFLPKSGAEVIWSEFHHAQLLAGALLLHPPACEEHDHGARGTDECMHCGRDVKSAQQYDVDYADGVKAAKKAAAGLPLHPLEELAAKTKEDAEHAARRAAKKAAEAKAADVLVPDAPKGSGPLATGLPPSAS